MNPESLKSNISAVLDSFEKHDTFYILGHEDPDADCLGSQRALGSWLSRRGKMVHLCSAGPWNRPEISDWEPLFKNSIPTQDEGESPLTVILDCSSPDRTGFPDSVLPKADSCIIDHHTSGSDFGDIRFVDPLSPSTTLLILKLIETSGDKPTKEEADLLFLGFCTDTGYFRHVEPGRREPLEAVARLVEAGASPSETHRLLAGGRSLGSRKLLGRVLERAELHFNGRLVLTWENWKDWRELGSERDSDTMYQMLMSISGVEAAAVIREQNDGICTIGLRSMTNLDVGDIARFFGGGGHKKAAGCTSSGDLHDVTEHLLQIFADRLDP
ncbi:MAG: DHH family phosphoesterase [Spirochaetaceae bacterium]|nr:DHH family phosphoesterase [Spirochaetaceae bacterium]